MQRLELSSVGKKDESRKVKKKLAEATVERKSEAGKSTETVLAQEVAEKLEMLSENDKRVIVANLDGLWDRFASSPEDVPSSIVYLDTAARPLASGVKLVADAFCATHGNPKPKHEFLASIPTFNLNHGEMRQLGDAIKMRKRYGKDWEGIWMSEKGASYDRDNERKIRDYESSLKIYEDELLRKPKPTKQRLEEIETATKYLTETITELKADTSENKLKSLKDRVRSIEIMADRLREILETAQDPKNLLFIDDYYATGNTYKMLAQAFELLSDEYKDVHWELHAFFLEAYDTGGIPDFYEKPEHLTWGATNTLLGGGKYRGFSYREDSSFKNRVVGVKKKEGQKYVSRAIEADSGAMRELRSRIEALAEEVVKNKLNAQ